MFKTRPFSSRPSGGVPATVQPAAASMVSEDALFDRLPLPEVIECEAEEGWALWKAAMQGKSAAEADTVLMDLMPA